ncbi:hypothetical protein ACTXT7_012913 [Hymenolepis weldensis]
MLSVEFKRKQSLLYNPHKEESKAEDLKTDNSLSTFTAKTVGYAAPTTFPPHPISKLSMFSKDHFTSALSISSAILFPPIP